RRNRGREHYRGDHAGPERGRESLEREQEAGERGGDCRDEEPQRPAVERFVAEQSAQHHQPGEDRNETQRGVEDHERRGSEECHRSTLLSSAWTPSINACMPKEMSWMTPLM